MPTYVYAVTGAGHPAHVEDVRGVGDPARPLRVLRAGELALVVSDAPEALRGKRRDLMAHQAVLERLLADGTVLPMRFGLVAPDDDRAVTAVAAREEDYSRRLHRVEGCREYNVKVSRDEQDVLRAVLTEVPEARRLNDLARERPEARDIRMALGELVAAQVQERHRRDAEDIVRRLGERAEDSRSAEARGEVFLNVSFLVAGDHAAAFGEAVHQEAERLGDAYTFRRSGPLPPYSFV